ncbi:amino acid permease [Dactylonectria macrodidyma]|uniref:Amino acid permease n=1 Tax=Dactylonectria macrodidyma TaxID=307937 RepID=A0A9P9IQ18_9HYPO|nr:amino acid permease [Dactylonectria macrodidyma]
MSDTADGEKNFSNLATNVKSEQNGEIVNVQDQDGHRLDKQLKSRHVTMIAIGGALGTGLLVGTGSALVRAGPASILIDYTIVGFVTYLVMGALGAVISFMPLPIGYGGYAARLVDPALGFATGYAYFFNFLLAVPNQISAFALIVRFWVGDSVSPAVFITIAIVVIVLINCANVKYFGEFEFWLSGLKVVILVGVILLLIVLAAGGGPTGDRAGFRYWNDPGAFAEYRIEGPTGRLLGLWSVMITAVYSFMGTELVGVTVGETQNARLAMPKAINLTFYRIVFFYVISVFLLGLVVPYDSPELAFAVDASTSASASPFVVAIRMAKIKGLDHVINACLVIFVFSAANSDLYIAARTLYAISIDGKAPKIFSRTAKNGVPCIAVGFCALFTTLAYMSLSTGAQLAFMYLSNVVTVFAILSWIAILITHIAFTRACKSQHIDAAYIPYRAPLGAIGSYFALAFLILLTLTQGVNYFVLEFDFRGFIVAYIGIPVFVACFVGYKFVHKTQRVRACEADLVTGVPTETVAEEKARVEAARKENETATGRVWHKFYNRVVSWLF